MSCKWLLMLFLVIKLVCLGEGCWDEERIALLQLKHFFNNYNSYYKRLNLYDWVDNSDCCAWERVECDNNTGRVIQVNLHETRDWELREWYLNTSLFSPLQQLKGLVLSYNNIGGCIENAGFERLRNLEELHLSRNKFNNSIFSSLASLFSLKTLTLSENNLNGIINIQGLSNLEVMDLSYNNLNNRILFSVAGLSSLKSLYLQNVGLKGSVDVEGLYYLKNLEELDMNWNRIGQFVNSKDHGALKKLTILYLEGMKTTNATALFLSTLMSFSSLKTLHLSYNNVTQIEITQELHSVTSSVEELFLDFNKLHINFPNIVKICPSLKFLAMRSCEFNGFSEVEELQNLTSLEEMHLDDSKLPRSFLRFVAPFTSLKVLSMRNCEFNGIPQVQGPLNLKNLESLDMVNTTLNTSFSKIFRLGTSLKTLSLSHCRLSGTLADQVWHTIIYQAEHLKGLDNLQPLKRVAMKEIYFFVDCH